MPTMVFSDRIWRAVGCPRYRRGGATNFVPKQTENRVRNAQDNSPIYLHCKDLRTRPPNSAAARQGWRANRSVLPAIELALQTLKKSQQRVQVTTRQRAFQSMLMFNQHTAEIACTIIMEKEPPLTDTK